MSKQKLTHIPEFRLPEAGLKGITLKNLELGQKAPEEHSTALPHRDDHYMLTVVSQGKLKAIIDFEMYLLKGPFLLLVHPGQVHQILPQVPLTGWSINFAAAAIPQELKILLDNDLRDRLPFCETNITPLFEQINILLSLMGQLHDAPSTSTRSAIPALLTGLLHIITSYATQLASSIQQKKSRPAQIKQQFLTLLYQHYQQWKKPSQYAQQLTISTAHLNDTIKEVTGRSVTQAIHERSVQEAQRLLHYTELSVKEISFEVGYPNPSHFIKIFKAVTGITPYRYRDPEVMMPRNSV